MATLQDAINATRNGNSVEAQKILGGILKTDTENTQAWYLLALLVDSPEKKEAYLKRVLALDPSHEKAKEELYGSVAPPTSSLMTEPELIIEDETAVSPSPAFEEPSSFSSDTHDSSLPSWLESENPNISEEMLVEEEPSEIFNSDLPDWLSSESSAIDVLDEPPTVPSAVTPKEIADSLSLESPLETTEPQSEPSSEELDLSTQLEHTTPASASKPSSLHQPTSMSPPSVFGWNIALAVLSLLVILTLIAITLQLSNLF